MTTFRRIEDRLYMAKDKYAPSYIIEMCKIGPDIMRLVKQEKFDSLFIIMMIECPRMRSGWSWNCQKTHSGILQQCRPEVVANIEAE